MYKRVFGVRIITECRFNALICSTGSGDSSNSQTIDGIVILEVGRVERTALQSCGTLHHRPGRTGSANRSGGAAPPLRIKCRIGISSGRKAIRYVRLCHPDYVEIDSIAQDCDESPHQAVVVVSLAVAPLRNRRTKCQGTFGLRAERRTKAQMVEPRFWPHYLTVDLR